MTFVLTLCTIISCILVQVYSTPAHGPSVADVHNACQANPATHLDDSVFEALRKGESYNKTLVGAHMLCMTTRLGTQNADGTINRQLVKDVFAKEISDQAKVEELANQCSGIHESTPGETALGLSKCIWKNLPSAQRKQAEHAHHHN